MLFRGLLKPTWIAVCLTLGLGASVALGQSTGSLAPQPPAEKEAAATPAPARPAQPSRSAAIADCLRLWDKGTHMSKQAWARTCERIQSRLDNLKVDSIKSPGADAPRKSRTGTKGSSTAPN